MNSYDDENVFEKYLESRLDSKSPHNQTIKNKLLEVIGDYSDKSILDLGCGAGVFSRELSIKAKRIVGIDISEKVIDYAKTNNFNNNIKYIVKNISELNEIDEKFDIVFSDMVFNYIDDYDKLLKDINKCLKENGILVFSQVHPISTSSIGESKWETIDGQLTFMLNNYCNISRRIRKYFDGKFNFYHRRFEELINIGIKNGFSILGIYEPYITEKEYNRPSFLIIKMKKNK